MPFDTTSLSGKYSARLGSSRTLQRSVHTAHGPLTTPTFKARVLVPITVSCTIFRAILDAAFRRVTFDWLSYRVPHWESAW